ncbi:MAG TPA: fucose isomerase [Pirellulaceae bacterium]|nr:fucose isomerase [Pirellulaceae bacterium]
MADYALPAVIDVPRVAKDEVLLIANGDLRLSANRKCWEAQAAMERELAEAVAACGRSLRRAHPFKKREGHGFIGSQKEGMEVFRGIDPKAPLIVAEAVWQYSHHLLHGLETHQGPILTVANWSGTWPGLVGMLNLNGSLTKAGVPYSTLWGEDFGAADFRAKLGRWLSKGKLVHSTDHVVPLAELKVPAAERKLGRALAAQLRREKAIMGVFDEGCMGMFNAIIPDHLLHATGVYKERLSQSALYWESLQVSDDEALEVRRRMESQGLKFMTGPNHETDLTDAQILMQCKMYVAAVRIADDFGCATIGIQYQQGLKDLMPASDLVEGTLNDGKRPPVRSRDGKRVLYKGEPLPHFNEVDECAGLDGLMTYRIHKAMGQPVENTLHDLRWGDRDASGSTDDYVWVFLISGSAPPSHFIGGWKGAVSERQPAMYFPNGGGTLKGISRPGEIVWSRIFVEEGRLKMDLGRAAAIELPADETRRRWEATTPQWPIMHAVTYGIDRDRMMARHKSNHIQVVYANDAAAADKAMWAKAAMADALGIETSICGSRKDGSAWG